MLRRNILNNIKSIKNSSKFYSTKVDAVTIVEVGPRDGLQNEKVIIQPLSKETIKLKGLEKI